MKALTLLVLLALCPIAPAAELPSRDVSLLKEVARAQGRGLDWLAKQQEKDGSWRHHPAITGLAVTAFLRSGRPLSTDQQATVDHAISFILSNVRTNGAIYGANQIDRYPNYSTAICLMTLLVTGKPQYTDIIHKARAFLLNTQFDESHGADRKSANYGGMGYGQDERADLSNTAWALEALRLSEEPQAGAGDSARVNTDLHWQKAIAFLQRCQNLPSHNDQPWAKQAGDSDVGGFVYRPGFSFANAGVTEEDEDRDAAAPTPLRSYGSMSYAGLKSYIYADLKKDDPRVTAAVQWLRKNYTLDENPGMGKQGLYYYYHTMARALSVYGDDVFLDAGNWKHDWRYELMNKLVSLQKLDGSWLNDNSRFWENDPVLATSYSLLSLEIAQVRHYP